MRRRALFPVTGLAMLLLFVASVDAAPPTRIQFEFDVTFHNGFLTALCGVPVFIHLVGAGTTTLHYDKSGALIREFDTMAPGLTTTMAAPKVGRNMALSPSISIKSGIVTRRWSHG